MLYQNEEPLVQRTCIKTANLQSDINTSDKLETQELPPEGLRPKSLPPEELKLQTLICGHQVLSSLSDKSLVSICQKPNMRIQTVGYQPWTVDELRHDAAQIELCRRVSTTHIALHKSHGEPRVPRGCRELFMGHPHGVHL